MRYFQGASPGLGQPYYGQMEPVDVELDPGAAPPWTATSVAAEPYTVPGAPPAAPAAPAAPDEWQGYTPADLPGQLPWPVTVPPTPTAPVGPPPAAPVPAPPSTPAPGRPAAAVKPGMLSNVSAWWGRQEKTTQYVIIGVGGTAVLLWIMR